MSGFISPEPIPPHLSGSLASGMVAHIPLDFSGAVWSGVVVSSQLLSGTIETIFQPPRYCAGCNYALGYYTGDSVVVTGVSGLVHNLCWKCAGYNDRSGGFDWQREHWIREAVPLDYDAPWQMVADYLEDHNKLSAAEYMRSIYLSGG